jgi:hypothetical protein
VNAKKSSIADNGDTPRDIFAAGRLIVVDIRKSLASSLEKVAVDAERHL